MDAAALEAPVPGGACSLVVHYALMDAFALAAALAGGYRPSPEVAGALLAQLQDCWPIIDDDDDAPGALVWGASRLGGLLPTDMQRRALEWFEAIDGAKSGPYRPPSLEGRVAAEIARAHLMGPRSDPF